MTGITLSASGRPRYPNLYRHLRDAVRREYFTKCPHCGARPSQHELARKYNVHQASVNRMVNAKQAARPPQNPFRTICRDGR